MKNWKRTIALAASATLMVSALAGCGSTPAENNETDICQTLMGVPGSTVLATLNGQDLTASDVGYWLAYELNMYSYYYGEMDYSSAYSEDMTLGQYVINDALNLAVSYELLNQKADELGVELTEEEMAQVEAMVTTYQTSYGEQLWSNAVNTGTVVESDYTEEQKAAWIAAEGAAEFERQLTLNCTTVDQFTAMNATNSLYSKIQDYYFGENGVSKPDEAELRAWLEATGYLCSRSVLFGETTDAEGNTVEWANMTDEQKAALKTEAQTALDTVLSAADPKTAFLALMTSDNDDPGLTTEESYYLYPAGTMVAEYESALTDLAEGDICAELVESSSYGYFLVWRLPIELDMLTLDGYSLEVTYITEAMTSMMAKWTEEAELTVADAAFNLDMNTMQTNLIAMGEELYASEETAE